MRFTLSFAFCILCVTTIARCKAPVSGSAGEAGASTPAPMTAAAPLASVTPSHDEEAGARDASGAGSFDPALVRETKEVVVGGVAETWRLVWREPPTPACVDEQWSTCLCGRLAFGETGQLDLVRAHPGAAEERLDVTNLYLDVGAMVIPHWKPRKDDPEKIALAEIVTRPVVEVMKMGDYDHDGRATEFALQLGSGSPCGSSPSILIGISKTNPTLHKFDLALPHFSDWETIRTKGSTTIIDIACGDHGADEEKSWKVTIGPAGFKAESRTRACPP